MLAQDIAEPCDLGRIDLHLGRVAAEHHPVEPRAQIEEQRRWPRDDLLHQRSRLAIEVGHGPPEFAREIGERGAEFRIGAQAVGDEARHLVARPAHPAFGDVERERRLPRDEAREFGAVGTLAVALAGAWAGGRLLRLPPDATTLIGVGTGICGASAIAATTAVIGAAEADVAYAMGTIFTFNIAAVLLFPALGHLLGLSQQAFGLWSGTAVNDTSSVVAAAYSYGSAAGGYAVVVKLTRSLMIVPVSLGLHALRLRRGGTAPEPRTAWWRALPVFILGFLAASALDTAGGIPASWHPGLALLGTFLITVALSGIGLSLRPAQLRAAGPRPLLLGGLLWVLVATTSLGIQAALGQL